ncbi:MAG: 50S ribosomal protein L23 [Methanobrevibacter sp.]|jgi:large subunit ribosomal protein L23|nr:50S ribosomal protein L23 [Candidatus Methanovirga basalitermitum]
MDPYSVMIRPHFTEKTTNLIDKNNEIAFVTSRKSNKKEIKKAFRQLFEEEVESVNTHINSKGLKIAFIKLSEEGKAEDVATKMGLF